MASSSSSATQVDEKAVARWNSYIGRIELHTKKNMFFVEYMTIPLVESAVSLLHIDQTKVSAVGWLQEELTLLPVESDEAIKDEVLRNLVSSNAYFNREIHPQPPPFHPSTSQTKRRRHSTPLRASFPLLTFRQTAASFPSFKNFEIAFSQVNPDVYRLCLEKCSFQQEHGGSGAADATILSLIIHCTDKDDISIKQIATLPAPLCRHLRPHLLELPPFETLGGLSAGYKKASTLLVDSDEDTKDGIFCNLGRAYIKREMYEEVEAAIEELLSSSSSSSHTAKLPIN
ncbi:hypothetical protein DL96DRAFT_1713056 [Flagelloscypha sp. PMI_526]|nr:hypothetical protein DL96DRAFT_1713056 [Flagelloscypha sp. PMI_526]